MCGLTGFIEAGGNSAEVLEARVRAMADTLRHRGPDDDGVWVDAAAGLALGFRRLSIIDLSPAGHQPMVSDDGRFVIVFNGEAYNFKDLRATLEERGVRFRGQSDSEVVLAACATWGVVETARQLIGMFAFALWDRHQRRLWLVRDRLGVKPLYWGQIGRLFLFGSELKALRAYPGWRPELDPASAAAFLRHTYCPTPSTIYRGINKLLPGQVLTVDSDGAIGMQPYWSLADAASRGIRSRRPIDEADAADQLELLLGDAVERRLVSDVPVGAFLSGGIDSSAVVAMMCRRSTGSVHTYSIGFDLADYDETPQARAVARHLGTVHTEFRLEPSHALAVIPSLPEWFDEPFADSSQVPTLLVSQLARRDVTVALAGDGGDEAFGGYQRYFSAIDLEERLARMPRLPRHLLGKVFRTLPPRTMTALLSLVPRPWRPREGAEALQWLSDILAADSREALYRHIVSIWVHPSEAMPGIAEAMGAGWTAIPSELDADFADRMMYLDQATYLCDDILVKVDRASMAHSLEVRSPFLDHRIVEFAWTLPPALRMGAGIGKKVLRTVLARHLPPALMDHPKKGFAVPIGEWLRGPLRDWAEDLLDPRALAAHGLFDAKAVRRCWDEHCAGRNGRDARVWSILMLQAWHRRWME
ncbi:MAG: asparagine synthase (glutamine-hydrolyzing) [Alphaproteobacteria bacterium]|nr:asparagine synthase (glutamine-hydrolyzing) [Alphaproteobacteria bacterium]